MWSIHRRPQSKLTTWSSAKDRSWPAVSTNNFFACTDPCTRATTGQKEIRFSASFAYGGKCKAHGRSDLEVLPENIFCTLLSNLSIVVNQSKKVVDQNNVSDVLGFQLSGGESFKILFENYDFTVFLFSPFKNRIRFVDHLFFGVKI